MRFMMLAVLITAIYSSSAGADACAPTSLQVYVSLGSTGCTVEDKTFFGFTLLSGGGGATEISPVNILVTPLDTPGNPGFTFDLDEAAGAGELLQSLFGFSVAVLPGGGVIDGVSLEMSGSEVAPDGANTSLLCIGTADPACPTPDTLLLFDIGFDSLLAASLGIVPVFTLDVISDTVVDGGTLGNASLSSFTVRFQETPVSVIPEPGTLFLISTGLLGVAGLRRRKASERRTQ